MNVFEDIFRCDEQGTLPELAVFADEKQPLEYALDIQNSFLKGHYHILLYPQMHHEVFIHIMRMPELRNPSTQKACAVSWTSQLVFSHALCYHNPTLPAETLVQHAKGIRKQWVTKNIDTDSAGMDVWDDVVCITTNCHDSHMRCYNQIPVHMVSFLSRNFAHVTPKPPVWHLMKDVDRMRQLDFVLRTYACKDENASFTDDVRAFQRLLALPIDGTMHALEKKLLLEIVEELAAYNEQRPDA